MNNEILFILSAISIFIVFIGGAIAINGLILGTVISSVFFILIMKLSPKKRAFIGRHQLFFDFLVSCLTFFMLGGTIVAMIAAGFVGLFTSLALWYIQLRNPS